MENLKLKMIDFTGKSENVVSERDMIFSFNNGEIKIYLSYVTGELKKIEIVSENEKIEKNNLLFSEKMSIIMMRKF